MGEGYQNRIEYIRDYEAICAVYLQEYMDEVVAKRRVSDTVYEKYKGLVVSFEEADEAYQKQERFSLSKASEKRVLDIYESICQKCNETSFLLPFEYLAEVLSLQPIEKIMVAAACLPLLFEKYEKTYGYLNDNVNQHYLRLSTAVDIFVEGDRNEELSFLKKDIRYFFEEEQEKSFKPLLKPTKRLAELVCYGALIPKHRWGKLFYPSMQTEEIIGHEDEIRELSRIMASEKKRLVFVEGENGTGRKSIIKKAAEEQKRPVLFVDFTIFMQEAESGFASCMNDLIRELLLQQCFVCFYHIDFDTEKDGLYRAIAKVKSMSTVLFVCTNKKIMLETEDNIPKAHIKLSRPGRIVSKRIWDSYLASLASEVSLQEYANKYRFTPGEIKEVSRYAQSTAELNGRDGITKKDIDEGCAMLLTDAFFGKAEPVEQKFTLSDLILPQEQKNQIKDGLCHILYRNVVFDEWGFEEKLSYGKGLNMLFAGPPGTGKTMAAGIVGRELGLPVYKADLSRMVSKYIGDTEKGLSELFDLAEKNNCILFFDEMDSLFGKRSEVKDSHDKYANLETSYLLQKLEDYEGIVLMATNFPQNIDEAFLRRINYVVQFPLPDRAMREELWKSMFTERMPVEGSVDFSYLAQQFELSGASIKSAVMSAAFMAAEKGTGVGMSELLRAVKKLLVKQGKLVTDADFGTYAFYLKS